MAESPPPQQPQPPPPPYPLPSGQDGYPPPPPPRLDGPAPGLLYGGFGIRTVAYLVDSVITFAVCLLASPALGGFTREATVTVLGTAVQAQTINPAFVLFALLLQAVYFVGFWSVAGRTPGMMLTHLRVLRAADGRPIGVGTAVVRFIGLLIGSWVLFLGLIWVAIDPRRQGWHDRMAGTFVVQEVGNR